MKKLRVSVGIPAYNEEANIVQLISSILSQKQTNFSLLEIIVITDGSTDDTVRLVSQLNGGTIKLIIGKKRLGQQVRQNQLIETYRGDVLIILEADILPAHTRSLSELVKPFTQGKNKNIGMVVGRPVPIKARGFFEKIMNEGHLFKQAMFADLKHGVNIYTAGGHSMRALGRSFTSLLLYPANVPEDAYTYLALRETGLKLVRNPKAVANMRNVTHFSDRMRQCHKFHNGKHSLNAYFSPQVIKSEYTLPMGFVISHLLQGFFRKPFWFSLYLFELALNRILTRHTVSFQAVHETYQSSKNLLTSQPILSPKKVSVTIGIPARNEEANMKQLLTALLQQTQDFWKLEKIIVVSDESTDNTDKIVSSFHAKKVYLFRNPQRLGQALSLNNIMQRSTSDVLLLINADVLPTRKDFVSQMILPVMHDANVGVVGAKVAPVKASTYFAGIINYSQHMKQKVYEKFQHTNPIYLCHGRARAFSKKFYTSFLLPRVASEDAYSYLWAKKHNFSFVYQSTACVAYASPATFQDHYKQSVRFFDSQDELSHYFDARFVHEAYRLPALQTIALLTLGILKNPLKSGLYAGVLLLVQMKKKMEGTKDRYLWQPSLSSKKMKGARV